MLIRERLDKGRESLSRVAKYGLVAKTVQVNRGGKRFPMKVYYQPKKKFSHSSSSYDRQSLDAAYKRSLKTWEPEEFDSDFVSHVMEGDQLNEKEIAVIHKALKVKKKDIETHRQKLGEYKSSLPEKELFMKDYENAPSVSKSISKDLSSRINRILMDNPDIRTEEAYGLARYLVESYKPMNTALRGKACVSRGLLGGTDLSFKINGEMFTFDKPWTRKNRVDPDDVASTHIDLVKSKAARIALGKMRPLSTEGIRRSCENHPELKYETDRVMKKWKKGTVTRTINVNDKDDLEKFIREHDPATGEKVISDKGFASTAIELPEMFTYADYNVRYIIKHKGKKSSGRFVDHYKTDNIQDEILFPPLTKFKVKKLKKNVYSDPELGERLSYTTVDVYMEEL